MATVTAKDLIIGGLGRADMPDSPTGFIAHGSSASSTELDAFTLLNAAVAALWELLYEAEDASYAQVTAPFSTANNKADYSIVTDIGTSRFFRLKAIDLFLSPRWLPLERANFTERNDFPFAGMPRKFLLNGDNDGDGVITLLPTPNAIYSMRMIYVPLPPTWDGDGDTINLQGPWREFIELHFAIAALKKERSDCADLELDLYGVPGDASRRGVVGRIRAGARKRDVVQPGRPADVMGDDNDRFDTYPGGRIF